MKNLSVFPSTICFTIFVKRMFTYNWVICFDSLSMTVFKSPISKDRSSNQKITN